MDQLKNAVEKSRHHLENIAGKIEEQRDELSEEAHELWEQLQPRLRTLKASLVTVEESMHTQTDEARLQMHLAMMDARDQWSYLQKSVAGLADDAQKKARIGLQSTELQAHLASMDARDFLNGEGEQIKRDFRQVRKALDEASHKAAEEIEKSLDTIGRDWPTDRS